MAKAAPVDRSTLRLSEVARHVVVPEGIVDTLWFEVEARCREFGDAFDVWQDGLGQVTLGLDEHGMFTATVGGITLSIPRQVAKTFIVGRIVVALCTLFPNLTVLWTAHRLRTTTNTFQKLKGYVTRRAVRPHLQPGRNLGTSIRDANGEQEIPFANGSSILFGAREQGFGRGFDEVDIIVFDEAQILTERALEDMVAATNQSRFIHGALLFYMGTPPRPIDPGEAFAGRRKDALERKQDHGVGDFGEPLASGDALFVETSADPDVGGPDGPSLDDPKQIEKANPSYPHRTPPVAVKRLRRNLPGDDGWRREGLGVWDTVGTSRLVSVDAWADTAVTVAPEGVRSLGVAFSADGKRQAVGGAVKHESGVHVELVGAQSGSTESGVASLVRWLCTDPAKPERWRTFAQIVISGRSHADVLKTALRAAGVPERVVHIASSAEYYAACAMTYDAVQDRTLTHPVAPDGDSLDRSVAVSDKKNRGQDGAWGWNPTTPDGDETPMEAVSLALWAARTSKRVPGRKAVVL